MSATSVECTEVEYAIERYSESPLPVDTKDKGDTAPRKRRRGFAQRIQVELDSSSKEAPTSSRSIYLREIHSQIDHNEMLQRRLAHSAKLLRDAERIAMCEGNPSAPQAVRPLAPALPPAPIPPLDWRQLSSSKCPDPPRRCMQPAKITQHKVYFQIFSAHFSEAFPCVTAPQAQAIPSDGHHTALDLRQVPKIPTRASAAATPPVKLPASAAIVKAESRFPYRKSCVLNVTCNTAGSRWSP
jgi:hypothetical protein